MSTPLKTAPLKIGIAGLGNVGAGVFRLLEENAAVIAKRAGRDIIVTAVSAQSKTKDRGIDISNVTWHANPVALADDNNVDVVVELMGGSQGAAFDLLKKSLENNKPVVTANKALLALRSAEVLDALKTSTGTVSFEAAVAGGIPVIKGLREGLAANEIQAVYGILNGTCNYILSEMSSTGRPFDEVLSEAQDLGYAEADPSFDVDGIDAAHKLSILSGLAFGHVPNLATVQIKGIRNITPLDIEFADELGYSIKLLGIARKEENGIEQSMEPCLVPHDAPLATVGGALNAVYIHGNYSGDIFMMGAGAGGDATASAVVADIIDIARGRALPLLGMTPENTQVLKPADMGKRMGSYFLRLIVLDQSGVIADISAILRDCHVSLESILQRGHAPMQPVPVILTSHETSEENMLKAIDLIAKLKSVVAPPHFMRIENFNT
jgi:homoserine dehydrogenase